VTSSVSFTSGNYNPDTSQLDVAIPVVDEAGVSQIIKVSGILQNGTFEGDIYLDAYKNFGLHAVLNKNAALSQASVDSRSIRAQQLKSDNSSYSAVWTNNTIDQFHPKPTQETLTMRFLSPVVKPEQSFLRLLNPQRYISVTVDLHTGYAPLTFAANSTTSTTTISDISGLHGKNTMTGATAGTSYVLGLDCLPVTVNKQQGWSCDLNQGGHDMKFVATPSSSN